MTTKVYLLPDNHVQMVCIDDKRPDRKPLIATGKGRFDKATNTLWLDVMKNKRLPIPLVGEVEIIDASETRNEEANRAGQQVPYASQENAPSN